VTNGPGRSDDIALANLLREHAGREGEALRAYEDLVKGVDDPGVRFLASMILDDERRHHELITEMLHQVQSILWDVDVEPQVPHLTTRADPDLRAATDRLLALEREDAEELQQLRRQARTQSESTLLPLLAELMAHDTAKHIAILEVLHRHVRAE
jgi:hypothetical protein